jgi:hypothetical protein
MYTLKYTPNCSQWHTFSLLDLRSQVSSQDALMYTPSTFSSTLPACFTICSQVASSQDISKYTLSILPSTPLSAFSSTHPGMFSRTLPIALNGTLPVCLTVCFQLSSQDAPKHIPNCTWWYIPSLLHSTLSSILSTGKTLPISLDYMIPCMLLHAQSRDVLSCRRQALGVVEYGVKYLVSDGLWRLECSWWQVAYVGCSHNVHWYSSLNLIFTVATMARSHDISRSWCWQLQS